MQKIAERERARKHAREREKHAKLSPQIVQNVLRDVLDNFDAVYGGFGDAPKFPHTDAIALALERCFATRDERLLTVVTTTLTKMASGGDVRSGSRRILSLLDDARLERAAL